MICPVLVGLFLLVRHSHSTLHERYPVYFSQSSVTYLAVGVPLYLTLLQQHCALSGDHVSGPLSVLARLVGAG